MTRNDNATAMSPLLSPEKYSIDRNFPPSNSIIQVPIKSAAKYTTATCVKTRLCDGCWLCPFPPLRVAKQNINLMGNDCTEPYDGCRVEEYEKVHHFP